MAMRRHYVKDSMGLNFVSSNSIVDQATGVRLNRIEFISNINHRAIHKVNIFHLFFTLKWLHDHKHSEIALNVIKE